MGFVRSLKTSTGRGSAKNTEVKGEQNKLPLSPTHRPRLSPQPRRTPPTSPAPLRASPQVPANPCCPGRLAVLSTGSPPSLGFPGDVARECVSCVAQLEPASSRGAGGSGGES